MQGVESYDLDFIEGFLYLQVITFIVHPGAIVQELLANKQSAFTRHQFRSSKVKAVIKQILREFIGLLIHP
jgi:hypothetical protein